MPLDAPEVGTNRIVMRDGSKGKKKAGGRGGALPVTMAVRPAAERPWVTWSAVEAQEKPEAPFRLKIHGGIVACGSAVVDLRRMNQSISRGEGEWGRRGVRRSPAPPDLLCILYAVLFFSSQRTQCIGPDSDDSR
jgi:hypothetical protein